MSLTAMRGNGYREVWDREKSCGHDVDELDFTCIMCLWIGYEKVKYERDELLDTVSHMLDTRDHAFDVERRLDRRTSTGYKEYNA